MLKYKEIIFVCTGNSCRSPMAEGLLKKMLGDKEDDINIRSAGISAPEGIGATTKAVEVMRKCGVDISRHRTRRLTEQDIKQADLILVMETTHKEFIVRKYPESAAKTFLLSEFASSDTGQGENKRIDIPDPIGKLIKQYEYCLDLIKRFLEEVIKKI